MAGPLQSHADHSVSVPEWFAAVIVEVGPVHNGYLLLFDPLQTGVDWHSDALLPACMLLCHESIARGYM